MISFDRTLPEEIAADTIMYIADCDSGNYVISNNYFHEHRARGLLLQSDNGLCENNRFYKIMGQQIKIVMDIMPGLWYEARESTILLSVTTSSSSAATAAGIPPSE